MQDPTCCSYPAEVHRERRVSTRVRRPRVHIRLRPLHFPPQGTRRRWAVMTVMLVAVAVVCVGAGILLARLSGGSGDPSGLLPVTTRPEERDTEPSPTEESLVDSVPPSAGTAAEETAVSEMDTGRGEASSDGGGADGSADVTEGSTYEEPWEDTVGGASETSADPAERDTAEESVRIPAEGTASPAPTDTREPAGTVEGEPQETVGREPETAEPDAPTAPEGWIPILSQDMSEVDRGAGYVVGAVGDLPSGLPGGGLWKDGAPAVLLVNTHPYEGFSDGSSLYDPASGALAVTETPYDPDGMVAFGSALTRELRGMGITVIHLRVPVSAEESAGVIYDRTETMIRYYCRLYPDIGLVMDLRRSAELTDTGEILRTAGCLNGADCGQIRISVNGGKTQAALGWDLKTALALRWALWEIEPTVSRPVRVKSGKGLIPDLTGVRVLTLEAGSAGNTYAEAERLISPLAAAIGKILEGS